MARCEICGNDYGKPLEINYDGRRYVFDSLECAIHRLAPTCAHCSCRIIGHGVEAEGAVYCCDHCARQVQQTAGRP
jgi:hypothetical protein